MKTLEHPLSHPFHPPHRPPPMYVHPGLIHQKPQPRQPPRNGKLAIHHSHHVPFSQGCQPRPGQALPIRLAHTTPIQILCPIHGGHFPCTRMANARSWAY